MSGTADAGSDILLRGTSSVDGPNRPLIYIDGVRMPAGRPGEDRRTEAEEDATLACTVCGKWTPGGLASGALDGGQATKRGAGKRRSMTIWRARVESTTTLRTGAAGVTGRLLGYGSGALNVRAEGWASWLDLAAADGIDAMDFQVRRVCAVLEWTQLNRFEAGHEVGLLVNGGVRYELNEGVDDINGMELGGGLRYASPARRLRMQGNGRLLLAMDSDYEEWGIGATVQIDPGRVGGRSLRLNPSYRRAERGVEALWSNGVAPGMPGMEPGRAKSANHTEYQQGFGSLCESVLFGPEQTHGKRWETDRSCGSAVSTAGSSTLPSSKGNER
ncbi:MAG: hypothetical protein OXL34_14200 [Gemmatimonadota bacterium]|nr:hypothetical protein [Gemmatimonadota bacterium]